jgi:hypothetical protein
MDINDLLTDRVKDRTGQVDIDGVGTVTFRALSRMEMMVGGKIDDSVKQERFILSCAMVDPAMTESDVATWQKVSPPGEINAVAMAVNELSGIGPGSAKEQYKSLRDES